jgi:hypothetical protein
LVIFKSRPEGAIEPKARFQKASFGGLRRFEGFGGLERLKKSKGAMFPGLAMLAALAAFTEFVTLKGSNQQSAFSTQQNALASSCEPLATLFQQGGQGCQTFVICDPRNT